MQSAPGTLRPLRMGEILDRAIRLYRRNFFQFLGIIALVQVPLSLAQIGASLLMVSGTMSRLERVLSNPAAAPANPLDLVGELLGPRYAAGASLNSLVTVLSFILVQGLASAALTRVVGEHYLGKPVSGVVDAFRRIKREWFSLVGALLLAVVLLLALLLWWVFVPCVGWVSGLGLVAFLWLVIVPLLAPIIILENQPATVAWRRAWELARRRFWWIFLFGLVLYVFNLLLVAGPAAAIGALGPLLGGEALGSDSIITVQTLIQSLTSLITGLFYLPLQVAAMTILYIDLRVRTEGVDLLLQAPAGSQAAGQATAPIAGAGPGPLAALATSAPARESGPLITGRELGYFSLVTVGLVSIIILFYTALLGLVLALGAVFSAG